MSTEYKFWTIYFPRTGSFNLMKSVKAKHVVTGRTLELTLPDKGMSKPSAIKAMKEEIDAHETTESEHVSEPGEHDVVMDAINEHITGEPMP